MLEINITLHAPELSEAINRLAGAMETNLCAAAESKPATLVEVAAVPTEPVTVCESSAPQTQEPVRTETTKPQAETPRVDAVHEEQTTYTRETISEIGAKLIEHGKMVQLRSLLERYGVKAVTQLDPNDLNAFGAELEALAQGKNA